jgi:hypothetical protein
MVRREPRLGRQRDTSVLCAAPGAHAQDLHPTQLGDEAPADCPESGRFQSGVERRFVRFHFVNEGADSRLRRAREALGPQSPGSKRSSNPDSKRRERSEIGSHPMHWTALEPADSASWASRNARQSRNRRVIVTSADQRAEALRPGAEICPTGKSFDPHPHSGAKHRALVPAVAMAEQVGSPLPLVEAAKDSSNARPSTFEAHSEECFQCFQARHPHSATDLSEQLRLIDAVRAAVAAGHSSAAALALASCGAQSPQRGFGQEAAVLRIETTRPAGKSRASRLARAQLPRRAPERSARE